MEANASKKSYSELKLQIYNNLVNVCVLFSFVIIGKVVLFSLAITKIKLVFLYSCKCKIIELTHGRVGLSCL